MLSLTARSSEEPIRFARLLCLESVAISRQLLMTFHCENVVTSLLDTSSVFKVDLQRGLHPHWCISSPSEDLCRYDVPWLELPSSSPFQQHT
jgi:hypothetical protein